MREGIFFFPRFFKSIEMSELPIKDTKQREKHWYALYVQPRKEKVVHKELQKRDFECYLPLRKETHKWADRRKQVEVPLFTSYVFVKIEEHKQWDILQVPGAVKFIWFGGKAVPVPEHQIESIKILIEREIAFELMPQVIRKGDLVRVKEGPFAGLVGTVLRDNNKMKFFISITSIGTDIKLEIGEEDLISIEKEKNKILR